MAKQLHVFVENKPGRLKAITDNLQKIGINIRAFSIQDRGDYGLMKLIVSDPEQAHLSLADMGCACALKDVLAISIPDRPGNLHKLLNALAAGDINIVDAHGFVLQPDQKGICILEIENLAQTNAEEVVRKAGFDILDDDAINNL
ncbi:MAG: hypothetical protein KJ757_04615 [Planctomycetes bacterium]|nr:hypothetical protein [Planctomycetota bacterium]MBU1518295.1 hypothetical protein [Planctomycetota bacterium]MBU2457878.1 hypothetical protein [Planctomycetota bacterium]MBU2596826.1 hypothetical protein [Planctomycetota bacterium]